MNWKQKLLLVVIGIPGGVAFLAMIFEVGRNAGAPHIWELFAR